MRLAIHTIPPSQVKAKMAPARISYYDLQLDPNTKSSFTTECLIDEAHMKNVGGAPLQYALHYTLSHYHGLGIYTQLEIAGGPRDGEVIMRHDGYGENFGQAIEPPLELGDIGARGLRFTCGYSNPRNVPVRWGIGDQEMCVIALQASTNFAFDGAVERGTDQMIGVGPGGEIRHGGPCNLLAFPWDFTKDGGPPR
jgi:hypothetical protein